MRGGRGCNEGGVELKGGEGGLGSNMRVHERKGRRGEGRGCSHEFTCVRGCVYEDVRVCVRGCESVCKRM